MADGDSKGTEGNDATAGADGADGKGTSLLTGGGNKDNAGEVKPAADASDPGNEPAKKDATEGVTGKLGEDGKSVEPVKGAEDAKEGKDAEKDGKTDKSDKPEGAPENYEAFTAPEGVTISEDVSTAFGKVARDLNLSQGQAQGLVDFQTELLLKGAEAQQTAWDDTVKEWSDASAKDTEFGGEKFEENLGIAAKVLNAYGTKELLNTLDATGLGNHPELIRLMVKIGGDLSEGQLNFGGKPSAADLTLAQRMHPTMDK